MEITSKAIDVINSVAPVWAAELAGRAKFFIDDETETAYVTNTEHGMKIAVNSKFVDKPGFAFVLMHEMAHVFRNDLTSMQNNPSRANDINIAADCIINDTLEHIGIKPPRSINICKGIDIYGMNCMKKSINSLINVDKQSEVSPSTPNNSGFDDDNNDSTNASGDNHKSESNGSDNNHGSDNPDGYIGLGKDPFIHTDIQSMSRSICRYARNSFFSKGFKSKNFSAKNDWRRNRSTFATRTDVRIPSTTYGEAGNDREGPLICLVLDTSGSMSQPWVATAAKIAEEIKSAGLDFDLWLTPSRHKAKNPDKVIYNLQNKIAISADDLEPASYASVRDSFDFFESTKHCIDIVKRRPRDSDPEPDASKRSDFGANELDALGVFDTDDPVVWIYIGDYHSKMRRKMFTNKNFLHVVMLGNDISGATRRNVKIMKKHSLPRWEIKL